MVCSVVLTEKWAYKVSFNLGKNGNDEVANFIAVCRRLILTARSFTTSTTTTGVRGGTVS